MNLSWAQAAAAEQKVKFSVEAGLSSPFVSQRSSGLSSIREAMRKAEEAKTATAAVKLGGGAPVSLIGKLMGARSATPEVVEQPPAVSFHERRAAFEARWADTVKSAPVAAMAAPPTVDRRYERLQVGQERKRTDFDKRMGLEKDWRTPEKSDGSGKGWHRDVNSHKDDSVEISTRKLKRELQQKAGLNRAFQEEEEPAKKVATIREILIPDNGLTVRELASRLSMKIAELTKRLVTMGVLPETGPPGAGKKAAALDQELEQKNDSRIVDADSAELLVLELGLNARRVEDKTAVRAALLADKPSSHTKHDAAVLMPRAPVVSCSG